MSQGPGPTGPGAPASSDPTTGDLIARLSDQSTQLIRDEIRLAQAEMQEKLKHGATGAAGFGVAGLLALYGLAGLLTAAVLGLDEVMPAWLAALVVALVVLAVAAGAALVGKKEMSEVGPVVPERAVSGVKEDVATVKGGRHA